MAEARPAIAQAVSNRRVEDWVVNVGEVRVGPVNVVDLEQAMVTCAVAVLRADNSRVGARLAHRDSPGRSNSGLAEAGCHEDRFQLHSSERATIGSSRQLPTRHDRGCDWCCHPSQTKSFDRASVDDSGGSGRAVPDLALEILHRRLGLYVVSACRARLAQTNGRDALLNELTLKLANRR